MIAMAVLLGSLAFVKVARSFIEPKRVEGIIASVSARNDQDPNRVQPYLDQTKDVADALKAKNLFVKAPPRQHPVKQVEGILGQEVLIGDKWYKVGAKIGEARIVSVESTRVMIEWDGKTKAFAPIAAASKQTAAKPPEQKKPKVVEEESEGPAPEAKAEVVHVEAPAEEDMFAWMGVTLSPRVRAKLEEMWNSMSEEQRQKAKEEWNNMPEEQRQQAIDEIDRQL
jgi:hypothetical protein